MFGPLASTTAEAAAPIKRVRGEPAKATVAAPASAWRSSNFPEASVVRMQFRDLPAQRILELQNYNSRPDRKQIQIGVGRSTSSDGVQKSLATLRWQTLAGGAKVSRIVVTSPDALGLRVGLRLESLDLRAQLRFAGSDQPIAGRRHDQGQRRLGHRRTATAISGRLPPTVNPRSSRSMCRAVPMSVPCD